MMLLARFSCCILAAAFVWVSSFGFAETAGKNSDYIPQVGTFPPPGTGNYLAGELVLIDPINRRGGLRLDGDFIDDRYDKAMPHEFSMLAYGAVWYHGAPADVRDIPIGTHLHGYFYLPPQGPEQTAPPAKNPPQYGSKYTHAILLEDDFSFYQRRGRAWKIVSIDLGYDSANKYFPPRNENGDWRKTPARGKLKVTAVRLDGAVGDPSDDGLAGEHTFEIDRFTRLWRGREYVQWEDLAPDDVWTIKENHRTLTLENQIVQLGLTWAPEWRNRVFHVADIWLDEESRETATDRQNRVHRRYQLSRGLAAWVDDLQSQGRGKGIVTVTLFGGMDPALYDEFTDGAAVTLCAAEETLRTYWRDHDGKGGSILEVKQIEHPPPGSSGITLRIQVNELLEGFRRQRIVRVDRQHWPRVKLPPEERLR